MKNPQYNFLYKGMEKILKTQFRLGNSFRGYISCLLNGDNTTKEHYLNYLVRYLLPYTDIEKMEKEFLDLLIKKEFRV